MPVVTSRRPVYETRRRSYIISSDPFNQGPTDPYHPSHCYVPRRKTFDKSNQASSSNHNDFSTDNIKTNSDTTNKLNMLTLEDIDPQSLNRLVDMVAEKVKKSIKKSVENSRSGDVSVDDAPALQQSPHRSLVKHPHVVCDICEENIVGIRYKCINCPDYDMCETCKHQCGTKHNRRHSWLKLRSPLQPGTVIDVLETASDRLTTNSRMHKAGKADKSKGSKSSYIAEPAPFVVQPQPQQQQPVDLKHSTETINLQQSGDVSFIRKPTVSQEVQVPEFESVDLQKDVANVTGPSTSKSKSDLNDESFMDDDLVPSDGDDEFYDHEFEMINPVTLDFSNAVSMKDLVKNEESNKATEVNTNNDIPASDTCRGRKEGSRIDTSFYSDSCSAPIDLTTPNTTNPDLNDDDMDDSTQQTQETEIQENTPTDSNEAEESSPMTEPINTQAPEVREPEVDVTIKREPIGSEVENREASCTASTSTEPKTLHGVARNNELEGFEDQFPLVDVWPEALSKMLNAAFSKLDGTFSKLDDTLSASLANTSTDPIPGPSSAPKCARMSGDSESSSSPHQYSTECSTGQRPNWSNEQQHEVLTQQPTKRNFISSQTVAEMETVESSSTSRSPLYPKVNNHVKDKYDVNKMMHNLDTLREMGFSDREVNGALLLKHGHDLRRVIDELVALANKKK